MIKIKRVYESFDKNDGFRILVDRLWPRGLTKDKVKVDLWLKDIAPSDSLLVKTIKEKMEEGAVTLVYGAKDREYNNAVALKEYLSKNKSWL